jgi:hypothetical protein
LPSVVSTIFGTPPSMIATAEFVVPKSIPIILLIIYLIITLQLCSGQAYNANLTMILRPLIICIKTVYMIVYIHVK